MGHAARGWICWGFLTAVCVVVSSPPDACAAFLTFAGYQFESGGTAALDNGALNLQGTTDENVGGTGVAFITQPFDFTGNPPFSVAFEFSIDPRVLGGSDGLAFVIHNSPAGRIDIGGGGGSLGYYTYAPANDGIPNSIAIEFDTFNNGNSSPLFDPNGNHAGYGRNAAAIPGQSTALAFDLTVAGAPHRFAWVDYSDGTLELFANTSDSKPGTPLLSYDMDLSATLDGPGYVGFTSSTGGGISKHRVHDLSLSGLTQVPEPSTFTLWALLGLTAAGARRRRRRSR